MENESYEPNNEIFKDTQYFVPGQMILHVEHPSNVTQATLTKAITDFLSGQATVQSEKQVKSSKSKKTREQVVLQDDHEPGYQPNIEEQPWKEKFLPPNKEAILTFPLENDRGLVFSLAPARSNDPKMPQKDLFNLLVSINDEIGDNGLDIGSNVTLRSVSPNWLMSSAHHGSATGGPGGWPVEAHPPLSDAEWKPRLLNAQGNTILPSNTTAQGAGVDVAILDTAPTQHALDTAHSEFRWQHGLIESIWRPNNRPLHLHPAAGTDFHTLRPTINYSVRRHRYWMRDHGLFVAGIIHAMAPEATLHLYEVLNPYGIGNIETVAQGLCNVIKDMRVLKGVKRPLIINCSFMLDIPDESALKKEFQIRRPASGVLMPMIMSIREIFELLASQKKVLMVAAAGNDSSQSQRKPTRYPAAFKGVYGVGALPQNATPTFAGAGGIYRAATYSNNADDQNPDEGYMTLGGEDGVEQGILGVYIDDFPKTSFWWSMLDRLFGWSTPSRVRYRRNTTGWAWWAGTSFAAAILSGTLAILPAQSANSLLNFGTSQTTLLGIAQPIGTARGETVIMVKQG